MSQATTATTMTLATASANRGVHPELRADLPAASAALNAELPASRAAGNPVASTRPRLRLTRGANEVIPRNHAESRAALAAVDATLRARLPAARAAARAPLRAAATAASAALLAQLPAAPPTAAALRSACPIPRATHGATVDPRRSHPRRYAVHTTNHTANIKARNTTTRTGIPRTRHS